MDWWSNSLILRCDWADKKGGDESESPGTGSSLLFCVCAPWARSIFTLVSVYVAGRAAYADKFFAELYEIFGFSGNSIIADVGFFVDYVTVAQAFHF